MNDETVERLLDQWESGELSAEEICKSFPEVAADVQAMVKILDKMNSLLEPCGHSGSPGGMIDDAFIAKLRVIHSANNSLGESTTTSPQSKPVGTEETTASEASFPAASEIPKRVARYLLKRLLGEGGFGHVFLAYDPDLERDVALKIPKAGLVSTHEQAQSYRREARIVAQLDHSCIAPVYDVGSTEQFPVFIVSKYISGKDLTAKMREGPLPFHETAEIVLGVAEALHYAHQRNVVHRDIKPGNILLDETGQAVLVDFGLALREQDSAEGPVYAGTPAYMSPEQARGEGHRVDGRSDIFSLGVVLYELLTGRRPFNGRPQELLDRIGSWEPKPPRQYNDRIPKELERICLKALSKRATERYTTALDLAEELRDSCRGSSITVQAYENSAAIIPKGLRSYDEHDADFFLELLPGPRDREGLPDSIRFWKRRLEESDPDKTFPIGVLYGPSGCGKSSLIKAGLLPRISESIKVVYVEATPENTESQLATGLRKSLPKHTSLCSLVDLVRYCRDGGSDGRKTLVVLDQFEQWLQAHGKDEACELAEALRQCDGGSMQCLIAVRDDFWMAITRFMRELEVRIVEGENSNVVDLFSLSHAQHVLAKFGRAFGALPKEGLTDSQQSFLCQSVDDLATDGRVVCVRLALFAEMMKSKHWIPASLKSVGGTEGVGVVFLEETLSASTAPPEHRFHQTAARAVLAALLPTAGDNIKGHMRSYEDLLSASGYGNRKEDFDELIRILDTEVRAIAPVDHSIFGPDSVHAEGSAKFYQLTHDYLVPSLREWLTLKQRETRQGRANLLLKERVKSWWPSREDRQLPTLWEAVFVICSTRLRTPAERAMLRRVALRSAQRTAVACAAIAVLILGTVAALPEPKSQFDLLADLSNPALPAATRRAAIHNLDVNNVYVFQAFVERLLGIEDPELAVYGVRQAARAADSSDAIVRSAEPAKMLATMLIDHPASEVRAEAFCLLAEMAPPPAVLEFLTEYRGHIEGEDFLLAVTSYLRDIDMTSLSDDARQAVIRHAHELLTNSDVAELRVAITSAFALMPAKQLLTDLIAQIDVFPAESFAARALEPLLSLDTISSREVVNQLALVSGTELSRVFNSEEYDRFHELECLIQTVGLLASKTQSGSEESSEILFRILDAPELYEPLLPSAVDAFVKLNADGSRSVTPLHRILEDRKLRSGWKFIRAQTAAIRAVRDLNDYTSCKRLVRIVNESESVVVRSEAVEALGALGYALRGSDESRSDTVNEITETLREILQSRETVANTVLEQAYVAFANVAPPGDTGVLLSMVADNDASVKYALQRMLLVNRDSVDVIVRDYLTWSQGHRETLLTIDHEHPLVGFQSVVHWETNSDQVEATAKAVAETLVGQMVTHESQGARTHAFELFTFLLDDQIGASIVNPGDPQLARDRQFGKWRRWWNEKVSCMKLERGKLVYSGGLGKS